MATQPLTICTVGHSTHPIDDFLQILKAHGIAQLVDIRTIPKSRHNPQFNRADLSASLKATEIVCCPPAGLGGLCKLLRTGATPRTKFTRLRSERRLRLDWQNSIPVETQRKNRRLRRVIKLKRDTF